MWKRVVGVAMCSGAEGCKHTPVHPSLPCPLTPPPAPAHSHPRPHAPGVRILANQAHQRRGRTAQQQLLHRLPDFFAVQRRQAAGLQEGSRLHACRPHVAALAAAAGGAALLRRLGCSGGGGRRLRGGRALEPEASGPQAGLYALDDAANGVLFSQARQVRHQPPVDRLSGHQRQRLARHAEDLAPEEAARLQLEQAVHHFVQWGGDACDDGAGWMKRRRAAASGQRPTRTCPAPRQMVAQRKLSKPAPTHPRSRQGPARAAAGRSKWGRQGWERAAPATTPGAAARQGSACSRQGGAHRCVSVHRHDEHPPQPAAQASSQREGTTPRIPRQRTRPQARRCCCAGCPLRCQARRCRAAAGWATARGPAWPRGPASGGKWSGTCGAGC